MKLSLVAFFLIEASLGFVSAADRGTDLLEKVKAKYATCSSFYCAGELSTVSNMLGRDRPFTSEKKFTIRFERPSLLRVDWLEPAMSSFTPTTCSLYTDRNRYYGLPGFRRTPEKFKSLEEAIGAYAGISGGITCGIPSLLLGKKGYLSDYTCRLAGKSKIDGRRCHILEVTDKVTGTWILAVDQSTCAILRSRQTLVISSEQIRNIRAEARKTCKAKNIPFPDFLKGNPTVEITTRYSSVAFDQKMKPSDFVFHPPEN